MRRTCNGLTQVIYVIYNYIQKVSMDVSFQTHRLIWWHFFSSSMKLRKSRTKFYTLDASCHWAILRAPRKHYYSKSRLHKPIYQRKSRLTVTVSFFISQLHQSKIYNRQFDGTKINRYSFTSSSTNHLKHSSDIVLISFCNNEHTDRYNCSTWWEYS